jgi:Lon protease-like protein
MAKGPEIPLFPLRTVLFPGGLLPLRIFETRYVDMVGRCMREGGEFGVLLIESGAEAGSPGRLAEVGTSARIIDFSKLPDGLLGLMCRGARRFRLLARRTQADGLNLGEIEWLAPTPASPLESRHQPLVRILQRVLPELGEMGQHLEPEYENAGWVADRLTELLPLERGAQQRLLEIDDPQERLRLLAPLIEAGPGEAED